MIIVTVSFPDLENGKNYDMEVPLDVPLYVVIAHIVETVNSYNSYYRISTQNKCLESKRLKRVLDYEETFESAGIWNGDYLIYRSI